MSRNPILNPWLCRAAGLLLGASISLGAWAGDTSVTVGNGSVTVTGAGTILNFPVTRSGDLSYDAYLSFQTQSGQNDTAVAGTDYSSLQGSWLLPVGVANLNIPVTIHGKNAAAADKTFSLNLLGVSTVGPNFALASPQTFGVGPDPYMVAVADINGDGKPDLIVADYDNGQVGVLINTTAPGASTPSFMRQQLFTTGGTTFAVAVADINGDGKPDIIASDDQDGMIFVLLNTTPIGATTASFAAAKSFRLQSGVASIAVADLNGDGKPDLVVGSDGNAVTILINNTATNSTTVNLLQQSLAVGANEFSIYLALADLNGDGMPDLIVTDNALNTVSVLLNTTAVGSQSPSFATPWVQTTGNAPLMCAAADVNGDGIPDLIVANGQDPSNDISVFINTTPAGASNPSFANQQFFPVAGSPLSVAAADANGDGRLDLIVAYDYPSVSGISVLLNTTEPGAATANFASQQFFGTVDGSYFVATADINGDGLQDIITGSGDYAAVFLNTTTPGGGPEADLAPASLGFGNQNVGTTSNPQTVTLTNDGNKPLSVTSVVASTQYAETDTCVAASPIAVNGTCTITVTFTPTAAGAQTGSITLTDGAAGSPQTIGLSGTGVIQAIAGLSSASLTFGNQNVGTTSTAQTVTLTNSGNLALSVNIASSAQFAETDNCNGSVAAGANCTISVTFTPTASGSQTGSITLTDNAANSPQTIALSGTGLQAVAGLSQTSLTFASQNVGSTSAAQTVTLTNSGNLALSVSIASSAQFAETDNCNGSVAAGTYCTISVTFTPSATGNQTGSITLTDNAVGGSQAISLSGVGLGAVATLSTTSLTFAAQNIGTTSATQTVTLTNSGNIALGITNIVASAQYAETDNCNGSVAAGANCTISVTFIPTATGNVPGSITITDDVGSQTISLTGTGAQPGVGLNPAVLTFGNQNVGTTSSAQTVTLTNTGTGTLTVTSIQASTSYAENNTCIAASPIAANGTCTITVTFTPATTGGQPGSVTITDSVGSQTVSLSGTGTQIPSVTLSPATPLTFGNQNVGTTSAAQVVTLTNTGGGPLIVTSIQASAAYAEIDTCVAGSPIAANGTCTISVTFAPTIIGVQTGSITIADDAANNPQVIGLSGTGMQAVAGLSSTSLAFGSQTEGTTSVVQTVALTNNGNLALSVNFVSSGPFAETDNCNGSVAASGGTCTISVKFTPTTIGAQTGGVTLTDNAAGGSQMIMLSGSGTAITTPVIETPASPIYNYDGNYVTVAWDDGHGHAIVGAAYYNIYQSTDGGSYSSWLTNIINPNFTFEKNSGTYTYEVEACNSSGCSAKSAPSLAITVAMPPTNLSFSPAGTSTSGSFTLNWDGDAFQYGVYQSSDGGSTWQWVDTANRSTTSYTPPDLGNGTYIYRITSCINGQGCSGYSSTASKTVSLSKPSGLSFNPAGTSTTGTFTLSWSGPSWTYQYRVYQSSNGGTSYTWVKTTNGSTKSYTTSALANGTYIYYVQACNQNACSNNSTTATMTVQHGGGGGGSSGGGCPPPPGGCPLVMPDDEASSRNGLWSTRIPAGGKALPESIGLGGRQDSGDRHRRSPVKVLVVGLLGRTHISDQEIYA